MSELISYLMAQARCRPVATARFASGEMWRRARLRFKNSFESHLPELAGTNLGERFAPFLPSGMPVLSERPAHLAARTVAEAEAAARHEFNIFGRSVQAGKEIDWHRDWESGYRWPSEANGKLRIVDAAPGADVKRPWELARFHHALVLGKAYAMTREVRYAQEFAAQVRHFLRQNPYPRGIHWAMPMEVALRAANWTTAAALFAKSNVLDASFWQEFLQALFVHGRFIAAHREWNPVARGNHYLSCVAGMIFLGVLFADEAEGRAWVEFARRELRNEMFAQVHPDGVAHEGSSGYHAFLTELMFSGALLLARHDAGGRRGELEARGAMAASCGEEFVARLEKMFEFLAALCAGREQPPIWGDCDDGRWLPFCYAPYRPAQHLLALGRALFQREDWPLGCPECDEPSWQLATHTLNRSQEEPSPADTPRNLKFEISELRDESKAFSDAGFFFFASSRMRGSVRCGPLGVNGWSNHAHCDQLSFELAVDGKSVIIDPGSYAYSGDPEGRNLFRSTRYHNSVVVNGEEQNRYWPGLLFRIVDDTRSRLLRWDASDEAVEFAGEHFGYERLPERVRVTRTIQLDRHGETLRVNDVLRGSGRVTLEWNWRFAPDISLSPMESGECKLNELESMELRGAFRAGPLKMDIWTPSKSSGVEITQERGWVSPRFGHRIEAPILRVRAEVILPTRFVFEFVL
jgi:hypothetical protein